MNILAIDPGSTDSAQSPMRKKLRQFTKGNIPWNKGKKNSKEMREKMGIHNKGRIPWIKGKKHSEQTRIKIKIARKNQLFPPHWNGGRSTQAGYVFILSPNHPYRNSRGYVRKNRLVMEFYLGRYLRREEVVHHINGIRNDNRIENLKLFPNHSSHMKYHTKLR